MALIKAHHAPPSLQPFSMADVEAAAKRVLLRARQQAEQLLLDAQNEAEALKEQAKVDGLREGLEQGQADGLRQGTEAGHAQALAEHREQFTHTIAALAAAAADLDAGRQRLEADGLREVVQLAAAIARRVTKRQALIDPDVLAANVAEAMRLVIHAADVQIAIHPDQRATLEAALPHLRTEWPNLKHADLVDDASLAPGGCRIFARGGQVDASLDTQLDRVIADLLPEPEGAVDEGVTR
jgi:flagellar assembly protein FliH